MKGERVLDFVHLNQLGLSEVKDKLLDAVRVREVFDLGDARRQTISGRRRADSPYELQ